MKSQELTQVHESQAVQLLLDRRNPEKRITSLSDADLGKFLLALQSRVVRFFGISSDNVIIDFDLDGMDLIKEIRKNYGYLTALDFNQLSSIEFLKTLETKTYGRFSIQTFFKILDEYRIYSQKITSQGQRKLREGQYIHERDKEMGNWGAMGESLSEYLEQMKREFPEAAKSIENKNWLNRVKGSRKIK